MVLPTSYPYEFVRSLHVDRLLEDQPCGVARGRRSHPSDV